MKQFIIKDLSNTFVGVSRTLLNEEIIMKIDPECSLNDVIESFERFLKACGYILDGHLEIVPEFENELLDNLGADE